MIQELKKLAEEKKEVYKRFMKLCNDEVFLQIIKASDKNPFYFGLQELRIY
ncbi:MAG: hypothetical protein ACLR08_07630 [Dorea longicatena]